MEKKSILKKKGNNMKKVLVTGGAGFIGSNLVDRLIIDGNQVIMNRLEIILN